jgi:hypothetical protein
MPTKFWERIGENVADQWFGAGIIPAAAFWGYGAVIAWVVVGTPLHTLVAQYETLVIIVVLCLVIVSSHIMQSLVLPTMRLLEGYGWHPIIRRPLIERQRLHREKLFHRYQTIAEHEADRPLSRDERARFHQIDQTLHRMPSPDSMMPTQLGNILRAAEERPMQRYGLDALVCWSRLWLLLPDTTRNELTAARTNLNITVRVMLWGALFAVGAWWVWWSVLVAIIIVGFAYRRALVAAQTYGTLIEATFDVHRWLLYDALHLPRPTTPQDERAMGQRVTQYLYRGIADGSLSFVSDE